MCIVVYHYPVGTSHPKLEPAFCTLERGHSSPHIVARHPIQPRYRHSSHCVFDIYLHRNTQLYICDTPFRHHKIKHDGSVAYTYVTGMKIPPVTSRISIYFYILLYAGNQLDTFLHNQTATRLYQRSEMSETLQISLLGSVDIQMIGIGCRNDSHIGMQPMERTVIFIGLDYRKRRLFRQDKVTVIITKNTTQERIATYRRFMKDMSSHARCRGLAMSAGKAQAFARLRNQPQQLGTLYHSETMLPEINQSGMTCGNRRSINDQSRLGIPAIIGYRLYRLFINDFQPLGFKFGSQR